MIIERSFEISDHILDVRAQLNEYLRQAGFAPVQDGHYQRGAKWKSLVSANPRAWFADLTTLTTQSVEGTRVKLVLDVTTTGQILSQDDRAYWNFEAEALQAGLQQRSFQGAGLPGVAKKIASRGLYYPLFILVGMLVGMILLGVVTQDTASGFLGLFLGGVIGGATAHAFASRRLNITAPSGSKTAYFPSTSQALETAFRRDLRGWGTWLIITGGVSFITPGTLSSSWGVMLVILGLGSFVFKTPALYVIYGVTLVWAAISNGLLNGIGAWSILALLQLGIAINIFVRFRRYNRAYQAGAVVASHPENSGSVQDAILPPDLSSRFIPWVSLGLGLLGLPGVVVSLIVTVVVSKTNPSLAHLFAFLADVAFNLSLLGFASGLGSLLTRNRYKAAAIAGVVLSMLAVLVMVALLVLGQLLP